MTATPSNTQIGRTVGDRVESRRETGLSAGTFVEDFADSLISADRLGREWAQPRRWAVALDSGLLVFVDDSDLLEATPSQEGDTDVRE
ncbi:hypothetical protein ASH04_13445 [Rhodococcus sp. Leaf233]|nr:hypothetical protein ASH04_13445 [Rhodococcus sp. Leaf233]